MDPTNAPLALYEEPRETKEQRRRRLAAELQLLRNQFNSKLSELVEEGLDVDVVYRNGETVSGDSALMVAADVSYQTPRKFYR